MVTQGKQIANFPRTWCLLPRLIRSFITARVAILGNFLTTEIFSSLVPRTSRFACTIHPILMTGNTTRQSFIPTDSGQLPMRL